LLSGVRQNEAVEEVCEALCAEGRPVWIGNVNSSTQFVLTGTAAGVQSALAQLAPKALSVLALSMNWPIHSELMAPVAQAVRPVIEDLKTVRDPDVPFYGPDGTIVTRAEQVRHLLGTEFVHPTLWNATFEALVRDGFKTFLEVGPGEMLSRMSRWIDRSARCLPAGTAETIGQAADILRA
jgi:[acyl-carrier-protein] S-malonyltransferase